MKNQEYYEEFQLLILMILNKIPIIIYMVLHFELKSRDSAVGIATGYGLDGQVFGVRVPEGSRIFTSPRRSDRLWGQPSILSNGYWR
jgi:hypothetical protein